MISHAKELEVLAMLAKDTYSLRKIATVVGVAWGTVKAIRDGDRKTSKGNNLPMAMRRRAKSKICSSCGASIVIWPCVKCNPTPFREHIILRPDIYKDMSTTPEAKKQLPALLCLANDLQEFATLNEIEHPLFSSLVNRSREIYNLILRNGRSNGEA